MLFELSNLSKEMIESCVPLPLHCSSHPLTVNWNHAVQRGIMADFSSTSVPSVPSYNLGLAQLEEIQDAMLELKRVKEEKFGKYRQGDEEGKDGWRTVAWTDTFTGQGQYLLASSASFSFFHRVYNESADGAKSMEHSFR